MKKLKIQEDTITTDLAWRIRQRGLRLPADKIYEDKRVKEIAVRMEELCREMDCLDSELKQIAN